MYYDENGSMGLYDCGEVQEHKNRTKQGGEGSARSVRCRRGRCGVGAVGEGSARSVWGQRGR